MYGILRSSASRILRADRLAAVVELGPQPGLRSRSRDRARVVAVAVGDRQHDRLDRREPQRQLAGEVLEQDPDEALVGPHQRAVDHHRPVLGVVGAGVGQLEALGEVVVELAGPELPRAAERVGHVHVDLRPVEGAVALVEVVVADPGCLERAAAAPPRFGPTARRSRSAPRAGSRARAGRRDRRPRRWRTRTRARRRPHPGSGPRCRRCGRRPGRSGAPAAARAASRSARCGAAARARSSAPAGRGRSGGRSE